MCSKRAVATHYGTLPAPLPVTVSGIGACRTFAESLEWLRIRGVNASADDLLRSALRLPREERTRIAAELLASLAGIPGQGTEAAWDAELERRIEQVDQGEVKLLDWNAVKDEIALALKRR